MYRYSTASVETGTAGTSAAMPFEAVAITSLTRPYAPADSAFPGGHRVPSVKGGTVTVVGCCFAPDSSLTTVGRRTLESS